MTTTHEPSSIVKSTPASERTSFVVPGLNVFDMPRISSMRLASLSRIGGARPDIQPLKESRRDEREKHKDRRNQFQIVWVQTPPQGDRNEQTKQHRTHHGAGDGEPQT